MSFSDNSVIAKARAVYGQSLTVQDYGIMSARTSVADVCAYLKQTQRYGRALSAVNPQTVHRGQLEALLGKAVFDIFGRFHRFDFTAGRFYFRYIIMASEIDLLLTAVRDVSSSSSVDLIASLPIFLAEHSCLDIEALGRAESLGDIAEAISGTVYYKPLRPLLCDSGGTADASLPHRLFLCERTLYELYYTDLLRDIERSFSGGEKTELKRCVLKCADMENTVICCRMGRFFGADGSSVGEALVPFRYRLGEQAIERLVRLSDTEAIRAELYGIGYGAGSRPCPETVEQLTDEISLDFLRRTLRLTKSSAVAYFALTECLKTELKSIRTVIEGVRYGVGGSEILSMIVV